MTNTLAKWPPCNLLLVAASLLCSAAGSCNSYKPNIDNASSTKIAANPDNTHTFCRADDSMVPNKPAATPASA